MHCRCMTVRETVILRWVLAVGLFALPAAWAQGKQDSPLPMKGDTEIGGFVGSSYGLDHWRVMGGGNVGYAVHRLIMPYIEYSYFPGIQHQLSSAGATATYSVPVSDFHAGVHIRFPLGKSPIVPYAVAGAGELIYGNAPVNITFADGTVLSSTIAGSHDFAANFGGGVRVYARERIGFRIEGKVYKPTGTYTSPFYKIEAGIFFLIR